MASFVASHGPDERMLDYSCSKPLNGRKLGRGAGLDFLPVYVSPPTGPDTEEVLASVS